MLMGETQKGQPVGVHVLGVSRGQGHTAVTSRRVSAVSRGGGDLERPIGNPNPGDDLWGLAGRCSGVRAAGAQAPHMQGVRAGRQRTLVPTQGRDEPWALGSQI